MTHQKHIPLRRCIACRKQFSQTELIRFARIDSPEGSTWQLDSYHLQKHLQKRAKTAKKLEGRGAWLCLSKDCHQEKRLRGFFKQQSADVAERIAQLFPATGEQACGISS